MCIEKHAFCKILFDSLVGGLESNANFSLMDKSPKTSLWISIRLSLSEVESSDEEELEYPVPLCPLLLGGG
jgi:hypothetical protein